MRMNGLDALHTCHLKSLTCQQSASKCPHLPTRNLQCMSCGRSMLVAVCRPRTWLLSRFHCRSSEMLGALGLASQSSPFFSAAFLTRVGFRGLSSTRATNCSCGPFLRCRLPFRPGSALLPRSETVAPSQPPRPVLRSLISLHSPCSNACQARLESVKQPLVIVD
jgi:hypothetical protein